MTGIFLSDEEVSTKLTCAYKEHSGLVVDSVTRRNREICNEILRSSEDNCEIQ